MIRKEETIWFPGFYAGRNSDEYVQFVSDVSLEVLANLVATRAREDGEWLIAHGFVGKDNENEPKMRRMMAFVADEKNVRQCVDHLEKDGETTFRTVDWVCRELADASKVMIRSN